MTNSIVKRIDFVSNNKNLSIDTSPITVKVELTGKCTLDCSFCAHKMMKEQNIRQSLLSDESFEIVLNQLKTIPSIKEVGLFYMGESALHPKLNIFYKRLKECGYFTYLTTNGTILNDVILDALNYIDSFKVSWNYKDENDFHKKTNKPISLYKKIITNINRFYDECHKLGKLLFVSTVLDSSKEDYKNSLSLLKYDESYFIPLQTQGGTNTDGLDGVVGQSENQSSQIPCWSLFKGIYIDVDLNVRTCCYGHQDYHIVGNLKDSSLIDILNGDKPKEYKLNHLNGEIPSICKECLRCQRKTL